MRRRGDLQCILTVSDICYVNEFLNFKIKQRKTSTFTFKKKEQEITPQEYKLQRMLNFRFFSIAL